MVQLLVTYMEMHKRPAGEALPPPIDHAVVAPERLATSEFLSLYRAVGEPLRWDQRLRMSAGDLDHFLQSASTGLYILRLENRAVGFCEFDRIDTSDVELTHFGLIPDVHGRRLGPFLLDSALRAVWDRGPQRIWLHTDEWDHMKAQDTYRRAGFRMFAQKLEEVDV
ncbi:MULTISPECIES: GNAT family N-acetyltransferase [unclassified Ensifer]|uniref:GNAT family N-acetyltransferase n=1 Tax=unclassified Ensifer TaxID=2633371 RepID=UPI000813B05B|nr:MULTISPECIES: GNAT family N-acetyltransferase [unclassified Ensifer]OCP11145.1 acetyltransferase [Ensifer sp. LC14]OCP12683.1 acetyltransferase [Ensifer sp. LC13]OCP13467.1 acetyltransferase [Ensifer sp. LC11]OCP34126.1 acetyltransferase [Ensifer sp. LC499]